jgi:hypothetical protein
MARVLMTAGSHVDTVTGGPEVYIKICQKTSPVGFRARELANICTRTVVSQEFSWIMEVGHRQQVGNKERCCWGLARGRGYL